MALLEFTMFLACCCTNIILLDWHNLYILYYINIIIIINGTFKILAQCYLYDIIKAWRRSCVLTELHCLTKHIHAAVVLKLCASLNEADFVTINSDWSCVLLVLLLAFGNPHQAWSCLSVTPAVTSTVKGWRVSSLHSQLCLVPYVALPGSGSVSVIPWNSSCNFAWKRNHC